MTHESRKNCEKYTINLELSQDYTHNADQIIEKYPKMALPHTS